MSLRQTTQCLGYQQLSGLTSATGLTVPSGANFCRIIPQDQAVRWRDDGVDPSATVGMPLAVGVELQYEGDLNRIKFFQQAATALVNVSYYV